MTTIPLPRPVRQPILAVGADLKCRPALARGNAVTMLEEVGDLASPENQEKLEDLLARQSPALLLHDLHPGYFSHQLAERIAAERGLPLRGIQHHRAHVAATCLDRGLFTERVVGLAFDGTGYGDDGLVWGGEFFTGSVAEGFTRRAHYAVLPVPGGDAAVREPWRIALALLLERGADERAIAEWIRRRRAPVRDLALFRKGLQAGLAVGRSSALGRWFDAASALLGVRTVAAFEAEPAIELQKLAEKSLGAAGGRRWPFLVKPGDLMVIDFPELPGLALSPDEEVPGLAAAFHVAAAEAAAQVAIELCRQGKTERVVASGGVFLNRLFDRLLAERLAAAGLQYLKPERLPPGDQAIALGQIGLVLSSLEE